MIILGVEVCKTFGLIEVSKDVCMFDGVMRIKQVEGNHPLQVTWKASQHVTAKGSTNP